jgi:hypothetical protein
MVALCRIVNVGMTINESGHQDLAMGINHTLGWRKMLISCHTTDAAARHSNTSLQDAGFH